MGVVLMDERALEVVESEESGESLEVTCGDLRIVSVSIIGIEFIIFLQTHNTYDILE